MSSTKRAIVLEMPVKSVAELGVYPHSRIALSTFALVFSEVTFGLLITRDTVAVETPASLATSLMLAKRLGFGFIIVLFFAVM